MYFFLGLVTGVILSNISAVLKFVRNVGDSLGIISVVYSGKPNGTSKLKHCIDRTVEIAKTCFHNIVIKSMKKATPLGRNRLLVEYYYNGTLYKIIVCTRIKTDFDEWKAELNGKECDMDEYLGPGFDFHGISTSANHLGVEMITHTDEDSNVRYFRKDEVVTLKASR